MKRGNLDKWTKIPECMNLLFFAQLVNDLVFDYSIPSNRISTLNSHYLCLDAIQTIRGIEKIGLHEGNLKPIMEELFLELQKDPVFATAHDPNRYFIKFSNDGKYQISNSVSDMSYYDLEKAARSIRTVFFSDNDYYHQLVNMITGIVIRNDAGEQQSLFRLTKSVLTELVNKGFSIRYIYYVMNHVFWNGKEDIASPETICKFFEFFDFSTKDYVILLKTNKEDLGKLSKYIRTYLTENADAIVSKTSLGNKYKRKQSNECFIKMDVPSLDPFTAAEKAFHVLETLCATYRLQNHFFKDIFASATCGIYNKEGFFFTYDKSIKPVQHKKQPSSRQITESMDVVSKAIVESEKEKRGNLMALINAIRFHSHSLDSYSEENQLLDLWAVFETILSISNKHTSDRIQQICMTLVPILKRHYIYSLFEQLADDIHYYDKITYNNIITTAQDRKERVKKVCEFVLLESKADVRNDFLSKLSDYPLLKERIEYYNDQLASPQKVYAFVEKHADRVRWQVMRIYRNRNMIIHNGMKMPYLSLLIENLHSYVDDFLTHTIHSLAEGNSIKSMCQEVYAYECEWINCYLKGKEAKKPITSRQIVDILSL